MPDRFDTSNIALLYNEKTHAFGKAPEALCQGNGDKARLRYLACTGLIMADPASTVLDVGCGFGETLPFLQKAGWHGKYTGIDIAEAPLGIARAEHPDADFIQGDIYGLFDQQTLAFDYVLGIGCFSFKLAQGDSTTYYQGALRRMFALARKACVLTLMSTCVDYQKSHAWHANPTEWYALGMEMTRAVTLHNYLPYEFALTLRRARIDEDNTFSYGQ